MMGLEGLLTGHLLCDRYRVERVIGRGGMGAVYCATDIRLERPVAVKVVTAATADVAARARLRARFHREARAAARLQHRNVVTVFDFGTDERLDLDFLVMELLRGEDVGRRLARAGAPPLPAAMEIVEQAARGIAAGHRIGLIHRDVKPGNVFLVDEARDELRACVLDFGIVQVVADDEEATMTHLTVVGRAPHSPAYAAPEQLRGDTDLSPACDVWGLGATAFQILTGERPFSEAEQRRLTDGMPVPAPSARARNPAVPAALDDLLRIALAHRPADRFPDAAAFADAIGAVRGVAPAAAPLPFADAQRAEATRHAEADDRTLLAADPEPEEAPRQRWWRRSRPAAPAAETRPAADDGGTLLDPAWAEPVRREPAPPTPPWAERVAMAQAAPMAPAVPPRRKWYRRAASALWQLTITLAAIGVAGAFGMGMVEAFVNNLTEPFYASVAGLTLALPWAVHRILGRRGSYLGAVIGCVAVAVAVFRFVAPLTGAETAVMALGPVQLVVAAWIVRATRPSSVEEDTDAILSPSISL